MLTCPFCGSYNLRYSRIRSLSERIWSWVGIRPLRCRDCRQRFVDRTWRVENVFFARCPNCWRLDLGRWSTQDYRPTLWQSLWLRLGANPWRCEYCRTNFVSFRPRKQRYRYRRSSAPSREVQRRASG